MNGVIQRFKRLLSLDPNKFQININNVETLNKNIINKNYIKPLNSVELYHGCRELDRVQKIKDEGFKYTKNPFNNKGYGLYFSSRPMYQFLWMTDRNPIFVCEVFKSESIRRYYAEIGKGYEYVVTDTALIIPKYLIHYEVIGDRKNTHEFYDQMYECNICDAIPKHCNCELFPTFLVDQYD